MITRILEKLFCSESYYTYQNLMARCAHHERMGWELDDKDLDLMDNCWYSMSKLERVLVQRWGRESGILPK